MKNNISLWKENKREEHLAFGIEPVFRRPNSNANDPWFQEKKAIIMVESQNKKKSNSHGSFTCLGLKTKKNKIKTYRLPRYFLLFLPLQITSYLVHLLFLLSGFLFFMMMTKSNPKKVKQKSQRVRHNILHRKKFSHILPSLNFTKLN